MDGIDGEVLRVLLIRGAAPLEALSAALSEPGPLDRALAQLVAAELIEDAGASGLRLTAAGRERARQLFEVDRERVGNDAARAALEEFAALDAPLKQIVTDWQLRTDVGPGALNDHSDPRYDERVLRRLAAHHAEACRWLDRFSARLARGARYRERLERAHTAIEAGDPRFVASPRVDSYHTVWFELHEELIRLAGRTRAEEAEAGRA